MEKISEYNLDETDEEEEEDEEQLLIQRKHVDRKRKAPSRFGESAVLSGDMDGEDGQSTFDDSVEDCNYQPEKKRKISKTKSQNTVSDNPASSFPLNFDDIFDEISENVQNNEFNRHQEGSDSTDSVIDEGVVDLLDASPFKIPRAKNLLNQMSESIVTIMTTNKEILTRMLVLERYIIQDGPRTKSSEISKPIKNKHKIFLQSIGLPFDNMSKLVNFEKSLIEEEMNASVVSFKFVHFKFKLQYIRLFS